MHSVGIPKSIPDQTCMNLMKLTLNKSALLKKYQETTFTIKQSVSVWDSFKNPALSFLHAYDLEFMKNYYGDRCITLLTNDVENKLSFAF